MVDFGKFVSLNAVGFVGLSLVAFSKGVGPLRLMSRVIVYVRAAMYTAGAVIGEVPGEWKRQWGRCEARARREQ